MTHVDWHPYPEEKPLEKDTWKRFLVTIMLRDGPCVVEEDTWFVDDFEEWGFFVIAWAKLPEPYRPPEPEDNHPDAVTARKYMSGDPETVKALSIFDE